MCIVSTSPTLTFRKVNRRTRCPRTGHVLADALLISVRGTGQRGEYSPLHWLALRGRPSWKASVRVLYVSPYPPTRDGIGNYTWTLAHAVEDSGAEIAVVVPRIDAAAPAEVLGALTLAGQSGERLRLAIK